MPTAEIVELVSLGITIIGLISSIIVAVRSNKLKEFVLQKMEEADEKFKDLKKPEKSIKKLEYVMNAVKDKYKILSLIVNVKEFIEKIIDATKKINKN